MKRTMIRALALVIALLLAALPLSVAEEIAVNNGQEPLAVVTEDPSVTQELNKEPEAETGNNVIVTAMEPEIQESDEVDFSSEDLDDSDMTVYDESSDASNITDHALPFDQSVACGDVLINVTDGAGSFPEGATLQAEMITDDEIVQAVMTSLPLEGEYHHNLFHIVVMDATGNVILPNDSEEQPLIYLKGLDVSGDIKVALYDAVSGSAIEIQAQNREEGIGFVFVDSAVYDVMIQEKPEAQPVDGSTEDQPEGEPANEPVQSQSEDEPENEEPSEEPQRNPVDETSSDEQPLEQPTQDDRAANDSVQPEDQEKEETEESAECKEETENQSDKSEVEPEDKGERINTTVEHLTDDDGGMDIELDDADAVEAAKLADPQYAAMALTYQYLPSILTVGDVIDLRQCLLFDNYNPSDVVSWKSSNTRAVKISKGGMLRALKTGKAKITVKTRDRKKRTISVSVRGNSIGGLFPKPTKGDAVALNGAFSIRPKSLKYSGTKLVAEFYLLNGYKKALYNIRGLSLNVFAGNRNNKIASQHFGRIKTRRSIKKGVSTFTVTFSSDGILQNNVHLMDYSANQIYFDLDVNAVYGKSGRKTVPFVATVIPNVPAPVLVSGIALNAGSLSLNVGDSARLTATVWPDNAENKAVAWSSSNSGVASVDGYGTVKANAVGTAIITARAEDGSGVTTSCIVTVVDPNAEVKATSVSFSPAAISINVGETTTLTGTVSPAGVSNSELQLYTSTSGVVEITRHTVRGNVNTITIKGLKKGSTTLTGYTKDGTQLSTNCKINVVEDKFNIKHGSELIMQSGETGKSIEMDPNMSSGDTYVLSIDSSYDWSVWTNDGTWMTLSPTRGSAGQTNLVMTLKNIEEGKTYSAKLAFTVEGVGTSLYVSLNKTVSGSLPNAPTNVTATAQGSDSIKVTWTKSTSSNVTGYKVYYGTSSSSGSASLYKSYGSKTTSATITGLSAETRYYVWVKATSSAGDSEFSSSDYDTTYPKEDSPVTVPNSPTVKNSVTDETYTTKAIVEYNRNKGGFNLTYNSPNGSGKYHITAIIINEEPLFDDSEYAKNQKNSDQTVKILYDDDTTSTTMPFALSDLQLGSYLKVAIGAYGKNNSSTADSWTVFGIKLINNQPVAVPSDTETNFAGQIWSYLKEWGFTNEQAAGIMGNINAESGYCPYNAENSYGFPGVDNRKDYIFKIDDAVGFGICQWTTKNRKTGLKSSAEKAGKTVWDFDAQMNYLLWELNTNYYNSKTWMNYFKSQTTLKDATVAWMKVFENPRDQSTSAQNARVTLAQKAYDTYAGSSSCSLNVGSTAWNNVSYAGDTGTISVTTDGNYIFSINQPGRSTRPTSSGYVSEWLSASKTSNGIKLTAKRNYADISRNAKVTLRCATHGSEKVINVTQNANSTNSPKVSISVSPTTAAPGDKVMATVKYTNAQRLYISTEYSGDADIEKTPSLSTSERTATYTLTVPSSVTNGKYKVKVDVSNSDIKNDSWALANSSYAHLTIQNGSGSDLVSTDAPSLKVSTGSHNNMTGGEIGGNRLTDYYLKGGDTFQVRVNTTNCGRVTMTANLVKKNDSDTHIKLGNGSVTVVKPGASENMSLTLESNQRPGVYEINVYASNSTKENDTSAGVKKAQVRFYIYVHGNGTYNGDYAAEYAKKWSVQVAPWGTDGVDRTTWNSGYNKGYPSDCANFVSQCLFAGGLIPNTKWAVDNTGSNTVAWTWTSGNNYYGLLKYLEDRYEYQTKVSSFSELKKGDVIFTDNDGHVMIVTAVYSGSYDVCGHTNDRNGNTSNLSMISHLIHMNRPK